MPHARANRTSLPRSSPLKMGVLTRPPHLFIAGGRSGLSCRSHTPIKWVRFPYPLPNLKITSSVQTCLNSFSLAQPIDVFRGSGIGLIKFAPKEKEREKTKNEEKKEPKKRRKKKKRERKRKTTVRYPPSGDVFK